LGGQEGAEASRERALVALLVDEVEGLGEPWRSRFLVLIADRATGGRWDRGVPGRVYVSRWLLENRALRWVLEELLHSWTGAALACTNEETKASVEN